MSKIYSAAGEILMNEKCDHCGRTDTIKGQMGRGPERQPFQLCHANPDGTKSTPDCYHLVTTHSEFIGSRRRDINDVLREAWEEQ
jgi:hypothetical protein